MECEDIFWNPSRVQDWMFHFSLRKHIALLLPLLESRVPMKLYKNQTLSLSSPNVIVYLAKSSLERSASPRPNTLHRPLHIARAGLHEQVTCISCHHGVVFHIWQKEVNLIGNVTSSDRMSTKTLSFPNRYFSDKLCISANGVCSVVIFKASKHFFVARLFSINLF